MDPAALLRAGSWQPQDQQLLKTVSDVVLQSAQLQHPKVVKLAEEDAGRANSVDSSSTAAGARGEPNPRLMDSAAGGGGGVAGLLPPLRQISLDVIQATVLGREKGLHRQPSERQNIFQDVFNELAGKDETAPLQSGQLYTLPSMQFLESMLSDFDRQATGGALAPLDIPVDAFDLPESFGQSASLRPTPFDQQVQQQHALLMHQHQRAAAGYGAPHRDSTGTASTGYSGFVPMGSAASAPVAMGPLHNSGSLPLANARAHSGYAPGQMAPVVVAPSAALDAHAQHYHLMALQQQQAAYQQQMAVQQQQQRAAAAAALRGPAPPQPAQPRATPRRQSHAYADLEYEEAEVTVQTSKSGRVRKVASFTGVKRRLDVAYAASESRDSRGSVGNGVDSGEVGSKGGRKGPTGPRGKKGRRTVCLNCGCHQTPQWRCGPLGPRTLCNACGVRYKKDLPLNCWPIRDGMVLPPGAVLPPGFVVPPGITIHTQPGDFD